MSRQFTTVNTTEDYRRVSGKGFHTIIGATFEFEGESREHTIKRENDLHFFRGGSDNSETKQNGDNNSRRIKKKKNGTF